MKLFVKRMLGTAQGTVTYYIKKMRKNWKVQII